MRAPATLLLRGDTYLDDGAARNDEVRHLWVVCSGDRAADVVVVSITTHRNERQDKTCPIDVGDHPFIKHTSIVFYYAAEVRSRTELQSLIASGRYRKRETMDSLVVDRIVEGFAKSIHTPPECFDALAEQGCL